jgi:hypothetical protein
VINAHPTAINARALVYRKFKLPLNRWCLADPKALGEIRPILREAADVTGVGFSEPNAPKPTRLRTVSFYDTNKLDLYRNNFVLRKRRSLAREHSAHQELVFKFRHPDRHTTESVNPRPVAELPHIVRFKEQVLPSLQNDGGIRRIFWHGSKMLEPCELEGVPYARLAEVFPALRRRGVDPDPDACVKAVNDLIVDESLSEIGIMNFAGGVSAKAFMSVWRFEPGQRVLTAEFSFQIKYDPGQISAGWIATQSESFYRELQSLLSGYTAAGSTKLDELYRFGLPDEPTCAEARSTLLV